MFTPKPVRTAIAALAIAAFAAPVAHRAQVTLAETDHLQVYMTLDTVGTLQVLNNYDAYAATTGAYYSPAAANLNQGIALRKITPGFQTAFGNMGFGGKFGAKQEIELYYELYMDTWNHQSTTYGHEGYLFIHGIPGEAEGLQWLNGLFKHLDLKVGQYEIEYGDQFLHRSYNANVKNNPLIGNYVMDPNITSVGAEVRNKKDAPFLFVLGVNGGTTSDNFYAGHGTGVHAKLGYQALEGALKGLRVSGSYYKVDHSNSGVSGGAVTTMWSGNRSGARYESVLNNFPGITPNLRKDVTATQFDVGYKRDKFGVYAHYGVAKEDDQNAADSWADPNWWTLTPAQLALGSPTRATEKWTYFAAEGQYNATRNLYFAARYSSAHADTLSGCNYNYAPTGAQTPMGNCVAWTDPTAAANLNIPSDGHVDRIALGFGYQIGKHVRIKGELVDQKYKGFAQGLNYNGMQAWRNPGFHGGLMEFAFWF